MDPKTDPNKNDQFKIKNFNLKSHIIPCPIKNRKQSMHKTINYKKLQIVHVKKKNHILSLEQLKRTLKYTNFYPKLKKLTNIFKMPIISESKPNIDDKL
jgi:hypothetical protein